MGTAEENVPGRLNFDSLDETEFEEFCFELLRQIGFVNVDWRKGTDLSSSPADSGRDIEAQRERVDFDGAKGFERWFVECKHQKKGVPPNELQNLLAWANAERPDGVLFMVSGFLSNPSKDYLRDYEQNNRPPYRIKYCERPSLNHMVDGNDGFLRRFFIDLPRSYSEIFAAEGEYFDRIWYDRSQVLEQLIGEGKEELLDDIAETRRIARKRVEDTYGARNLGPYSEFEWGMINGKLSALRWMMGDDWDMLDT
jgi:hypothetical protein